MPSHTLRYDIYSDTDWWPLYDADDVRPEPEEYPTPEQPIDPPDEEEWAG